MRTSLKKLQKFAAFRQHQTPLKKHQLLPEDELARATQDMNDMRGCYDRLLSSAAATANSVYEFSESLGELGDCLLEKTALNDDEESGKVLLMLGKVQFELQKLVDNYRSHIFQTITIPSESILNELHMVEEMKKRCDGKREIYEDLMKQQREKRRLRSTRGECFPSHQLRAAHDEYDDEANAFVFRMKSLKQGQSHSLLTQASRHHAAQLYFFKKALKSLEAIEPHVRLVAEQQHIDYQFNGLKYDGAEIYGGDDESDSEGDNDTEYGSETLESRELSFDYGRNGQEPEVSASEASTEVILQSPGRNSFSFRREIRAVSKSAPLFPEKKLDSAKRLRQMRPSPSRKFTSYVLPTPDKIKSPRTGKLDSEVPQTRQPVVNLWHSSPLDQKKYEKHGANKQLSGPIISGSKPVLKESNSNIKASWLPPQGPSFKQIDPSVSSDAKKVKRQAFSGPLTGNLWPNNPNFSVSGPIVSSGYTPAFSGSLLQAPLSQPASTPKLSSPKISELHELPRPPAHLATKTPSNWSTLSGPLISKSRKCSTVSVSKTSTAANMFPMPPLALARSYSIAAGGQIEEAVHVLSKGSQDTKMAEYISSPPLTPISLPNIKPVSLTLEMVK